MGGSSAIGSGLDMLIEFPYHTDCPLETVAFCNSLTILLARLSRLCRKDEAQGDVGEV